MGRNLIFGRPLDRLQTKVFLQILVNLCSPLPSFSLCLLDASSFFVLVTSVIVGSAKIYPNWGAVEIREVLKTLLKLCSILVNNNFKFSYDFILRTGNVLLCIVFLKTTKNGVFLSEKPRNI